MPLSGTLSQQGLLDSMKPAYDRRWPDDQLS